MRERETDYEHERKEIETTSMRERERDYEHERTRETRSMRDRERLRA